jgi:hypothetical protein
MWDILGGISVLIIVIGIYVYYGRKVFNFIRRQIGIRQFIKHQRVQQVVDSMTQEDWKNYGDWMKKKIEQENDDKQKGKFKF